MPTSLSDDLLRSLSKRLTEAQAQFAAAYPGEPIERQPVHTVYGGAHLFRADVAPRLGVAALASLEEFAPEPGMFARAIGAVDLGPEPVRELYARVVEKLKREPVEDYRIDFEDGYGNRTDAEEDGHAESTASEMARGLAERTLPPFIGIRIKPLSGELHRRSLRTLDRFVTTLLQASGGVLPPQFAVTLPKVTSAEHVRALVDALDSLERANKLSPRSIRVELMVETPQSLFGPHGEILLPKLLQAGDGRVRGAHFGTYDYTAGVNITAAWQLPSHPACDFARHVLQVCAAGTGVSISDGATTIMPVGPHRAPAGGPDLTEEHRQENMKAVHKGWRTHFDDVRTSLRNAYYQGWDLNPAQLPTRYAAGVSFFMESRDEAGARLRAFVDKAAQATLLGTVFDDAATGQGLLNFFLRGLNCGAITEQEALATGLTLDELRGRSFVRILDARRAATAGVAR